MMPGRAFVPVKELKVVCFFIFFVFIIFSPPRALFFISHPHTHNQPLGLLSFLSAVHLSFFLFTLPVTSRPSPSPLFCSSLSPSQRVIKSNLSRCQRMEAEMGGWMELLGPSSLVFERVLSSRVLAVPRPCPRPALFHKHPGDSVIFSAVFTSSGQTSRGDDGKVSHAVQKRA